MGVSKLDRLRIVTSQLCHFRTKPLKPPTRILDGPMVISAPLPQTAMDTARGRPLKDGCIYSLSSIPGIPDSSSEQSETGNRASVERDVYNPRVSPPGTLIYRAPAPSTAKDTLGPQRSTGKERDIEKSSIDEEAGSSVDMLESEDNVHSHAEPPPVTRRYGELFTPTQLGHLPHTTERVKSSNGHQIRFRSEGRNQSNTKSVLPIPGRE